MIRVQVKHWPNAISAARLAAMPVLLVLALERRPRAFAWLLLAGFLSDVVDGFLARSLHIESAIGSKLDSTADLLLSLVAAVGVVVLQPVFVVQHAIQLLVLVALYVLAVVCSLMRYGRLASFHTYTTRLWAYTQAAFLIWLFFWGYNAWLFYLAWGVGVVSHVEEFLLMAALPHWTHDVRGLYWVVKARAD